MMANGLDVPGNAFHEWDTASRRRYAASLKAPRSSWDVPADWLGGQQGAAPAPAPASPGAMTQGYGGDPALEAFRATALADATARTAGARLTAQNAAPGDPSLAAYGGLAGGLQGQSDASHAVNQVGAHFMDLHEQQRWQEHMRRLEAALQEEAIRKANAGAGWGELGGLVGQLGSAAISAYA